MNNNLEDIVERDFFMNDEGNPIPIISCIFPIFKVYEMNQINFIGTGFFISPCGIFVTAAHVLKDLLEEDGTIQARLVASYLEHHKNNFTFREIDRVFIHKIADIGIGFMKKTEIDGKNLIINSYLPISLYWPRHNEIIECISFPESHVFSSITDTPHPYFKPKSISTTNLDSTVILPNLFKSLGHITRLHKNGRDKVLLPGPCYEAHLQVYGGSSGGPIFDGNGLIIGVVSTGFDDIPCCHFTPISEILDIEINSEKISMDTLSERGFVEIIASDKPPLHPAFDISE